MERDLGGRGVATMEGSTGMSVQGKPEFGVEKKGGLRFPRVFTRAGSNPFDEVEWDLRTAVISNENGQMVFEQRDVEFPKAWSQMATNVVASKYFRGQIGTPERERSVRQLIGRVVTTIQGWGLKQGYFASDTDGQNFADELTYLLLHQKASFNSPVWFNCGVEQKPQCSACFINSVGDTMEGILNLAKTEGLLFKWGSGTGTNFSSLRSSKEHIAGGGTASGPVSFMKGFDAFAGVIKSSGRTRRAAKMVILNIDHPDIVEYIKCKAEEEKKAWTLIDAGYNPSLNGPAYASIFFQNSNNSVRVSDDYKHGVETMILAQEIIVDNASYPTPAIERNSHDYRPLGLGYANLGALLMSWGVPYDSAEGRSVAAFLTALMHGHAYATSARIAAVTEPFLGFAKNREPMLRVIAKHRS